MLMKYIVSFYANIICYIMLSLHYVYTIMLV